MIDYPTLNHRPVSREMLDVFKGYNRNLRIGEGEFRDMENLSSDCYPVLSVRKRRRLLDDTGNKGRQGKITGIVWTDRWGLLYAQGENLYRMGIAAPFVKLGLDDQPKRFVFMGAYLVIWPDMKYINLEQTGDYGPLGHSVEVTSGEVKFQLCKADGEVYGATTVQDTQPENPADGALWIDTSGSPHVLKQYSAAMERWATIPTTYVKIDGLNHGKDGQWFSQYDGVTISGITISEAAHLNGAAVLQSKSNSASIVIIGLLDKAVTQTCTAESSIRVERRIPVMDYVVEAGNRLWGCRHGKDLDGNTVNEIYGSKLGDPKNWSCFMGIATDSWTASIGSQGDFTGAASIGGYPVFYKRDVRHKVWISDSGAHQIASLPCQGVKGNCGGSVAVMDGVAVYKSVSGFCMDDGSGPVEIGQCFAGVDYSNALGCVCGHKYYVSMVDEDDMRHLFVYDAQRKLWHREDNFPMECIWGNSGFVAASDGVRILDISSGFVQEGRMEEPVRWMAETGEIGLDTPDRKYISRLDLRLSMEVGAELTVYVQYDTEPEWVALGSIRGTSLQSFSLPLRLRRCDHLRLRFEGEGDIKIYSITKTIMKGSDRR
ncbi:MAG: hypothetical protein IJB11_04550 [Oscillospiraceae bacterium]|nr:hypothetical protein [Oscillospiraceae bacterium]